MHCICLIFILIDAYKAIIDSNAEKPMFDLYAEMLDLYDEKPMLDLYVPGSLCVFMLEVAGACV